MKQAPKPNPIDELDALLRADGVPTLVVVKDAAIVMQCSTRTIWRRIASKELDAKRRRGGKVLILRRSIAAYLAA